ncbi:MAG: MFS transporter [Actinobacteria bacterium]|nr:MFS transporter [Actinomycetota bacterium]
MYEVALPRHVEPAHASREQLRRARIAVAITFAANGLIMGAWAPRIPEVKNHLDLSSASLGVALLAPAVGSLVSMRLIGGWTSRFGSAAATRWMVAGNCASAWLVGVAPNLATLCLALLVIGFTVGGLDVAMNAQGVTVETGYRRPVLSSFHAAWSIGSFAGAVIGGIGAGLHVPIWLQQSALGVVLATATLWAGRAFLADPSHEAGDADDAEEAGDADEANEIAEEIEASPLQRRRLRLPELRLVLLGIAGIFALMSEGAVSDWSGVLLRDHLHVRAGQVGFAFAAFSIMMTAGRVVGDRIVHALGRARCVAGLSVVGAAGLAIGMGTNTLSGDVIGFAFLGVGLAVMVPVLFSTAADTDGPSGPAIATVSSFGYLGFLLGPSGIGLVAQAAGVPFALWLLPFFTLAGGVLGVIAVRLTGARKAR